MNVNIEGRWCANPYPRLLGHALESVGATVAYTVGVSALRPEDRYPDAIHMQFLSRYAGDHRIVSALMSYKKVGTGLFATIHERIPSDSSSVSRMRWLIENALDGVFVHSRFAQRDVADVLNVDAMRVNVVPHGPYECWPVLAETARAVRTTYGLSAEDFVFATIGRNYSWKRHERVVAAFRRLRSSRARLVLTWADPKLVQDADGDQRIRCLAGPMAETELAHVVAASDAVVLAYDEAYSSGSVHLALGYGRRLVVPRHSYFAEIVPDAGHVWLDSVSVDDIKQAMNVALTTPGGGLVWAPPHTWRETATRLSQAYSEAAGRCERCADGAGLLSESRSWRG